MTEVEDVVIETVIDRSRNLLLTELVGLIEREHRTESPGIARGTLGTYADVLADQPNLQFDPEQFANAIEDARIGTRTWVDDDALYDLGDDRLSVYPQAWHDRLGGETDVREYIEYLQSDESGFADGTPRGGRGDGIDQPTLVDVVSMLGDVDRNAVQAQIEDRRAEGQLQKSADQHPEARVELDRSGT
jgi:hypothetical protein